LRSAVRSQATAQGIDLNDFDFDVIYTGGGKPDFDFGGLGYIGSPGAWVVGASTSTTCHEMGHNLGNPHANFWDTGGITAIGNGDNQEYGDPADLMGGGSAQTGHYVAKFKWHIGWISDADFPHLNGSGTYRIYAQDLPNARGLRGLRMTKSATVEYFVEFRQLHSENRWLTDGLALKWGNPNSWSSQLIDTTPGSGNGKNDAAIAIGRTFSDSAAGVHITPIGKGHTYPESIDVVVRLGPQPGNLPPGVVVEANTLTPAVGAPVIFEAHATDPNNDTLAYYWEFSDSSANVSFDNSPSQTVTFATAGEYTARCVVSDMRGGVAQQTLLVRVGAPATFRISGHVLDNQNRPLQGILVSAGTGTAKRTAFSDSDGSYVIAGLTATNYAMAALESVADSMSFLKPYFTSPVSVGPSFASADFVGIPGNLSVYTPLVAKNSAGWRYNDSGTDLGTGWRALGFNDAPWGTGTAPLGYPVGSASPVTTLVSYGPNAANKYPTTYFRKQFSVLNPAVYTNLLVEMLRDDGAVVYLNGTELVRDNLPTTAIAYSTYASSSSAADAYLPFPVPRTALVAGNNVLAVEVHQANATSSDIVMDVGLSGLSVSNVTGLKLVYLSEPGNGARYLSPTNINLQTTVLAGGTPATRVDYYADGAKVAESSAAPYLAQWAGPPNGTHLLTAVALVSGIQYTSPTVRVLVESPSAPPVVQSLIVANATWRYLAQATAASASWASPSFNDAAWPSGPAELGFGDGGEATVVPGGPTTARYSTIYFRRTFVVDDPAGVDDLIGSLRRDDGAIIYLNGTEVVRDNIAPGTVTYATLAESADDDGAIVFSHLISPAGLVHGTNTIAVEVHQSALNSTDLSFQLSLAATLHTNRTRGCWLTAPGDGESIELPGSLMLTAEVVAGGGLGVARVEFFADGNKLGEDTTAPFHYTWLNPSSGPHVLTAVATDRAGQTIPSAGVNVTVGAPPIGTALISFGDVWKYRDSGIDPGASWTSRFYDDRSWSAGAAKLGYATPGLNTTVSYGPNPSDKRITTWFRKGFSLASTSGLSGLYLRLVRDDGAVVYLNGLEVYRDNLQPGPISANSTALAAIGSPDDVTPIEVILPLNGLFAGTNVVTVEVHQSGPTSSDLAFNLELTALTPTNAATGLYLASPAQNSRFTVPAAVPLSVYLSGPPSGPVEFFANGVKIGEDSTAPYELTWNTSGIGFFALTAQATLNGSPMTSPAMNITITSTPPPISPIAQTLIPVGAAWRYLDSATPPATDWNRPGFNDAIWPSGNARFGHGLDGEITALTPNRTTHYFRRWFNAANPSLYTTVLFQLVRDDGAVVYLNGQEIFRSNMPNGPINAATLATATVNTPEETEFMPAAFAAAGSGMLSGSNLVAVELHQASPTSSDAGFDLIVSASGTTEPRFFLGSPVQGTTVFYGRTLPLEAHVSLAAPDSVSSIEFFVNGASAGAVSTAPYRVNWTFTTFGLQTITARLTTTGGATINSDPVTVRVEREALSTQFISSGATWKYLDTGANLGNPPTPAWAQIAYNDSTWLTGAARLGYGGDGEITPLRETRTDNSRIITYYFRKAFTVPPGGIYTNLLFNLLRDDGAIVYLNGREIYRTNLAAGAITYTSLATVGVQGAEEQTFYPTSITVTNLPVGPNVVAVEVHQQSTTSSDVGFDLSLQASGHAEDTTPPRLDVLYRDGLVELSWPTSFVGWRVYSSATLAPPWSPLGQTPFIVSGRYVVTLSPTGSQLYFRLGKP
jgi:hypothetical protein